MLKKKHLQQDLQMTVHIKWLSGVTFATILSGWAEEAPNIFITDTSSKSCASKFRSKASTPPAGEGGSRPAESTTAGIGYQRWRRWGEKSSTGRGVLFPKGAFIVMLVPTLHPAPNWELWRRGVMRWQLRRWKAERRRNGGWRREKNGLVACRGKRMGGRGMGGVLVEDYSLNFKL